MIQIKNILPILFLFLALKQTNAQETEIIYLSGIDSENTVEWDFYCTQGRNSGEWSKINVPSNWELQGFGTYNYGHDWSDETKKLGKERGLYKTKFNVPNSWKGKVINIVFDGVMTDTKVKVNGKIVGEIHQGGFYRFKYDITEFLKYGQSNLLEVDVAKHSSNNSINEAERQADFWIFGGIYRPVFLEVLPKINIQRVAVDARADGTINLFTELNKQTTGNILIELFEINNREPIDEIKAELKKDEKELTLNGKFTGIKAWNPETPNLYDIKITLLKNGKTLHTVKKRTGFRTVELRKNDGFYVNGTKVLFKGVNRHSFWPETGRCLSERNHVSDIALMKEMNMNAVRMSHYPPDGRFLELCDSLGLFVFDEVTGWQQAYDTIVGPILIKETILKDENHPCVIAWNHGNEGGWDFTNEKWFNYYDIQNRPVLYPWLLRNGVDCHHYPPYNLGINRFANGENIFMPAEFLHGLYDGGLGASLSDYWTLYNKNPSFSGAFLWNFSDEAVLRTDMDYLYFDSDGNHGADGILGPHREKEGSFYTIRKVWSPVKIESVEINNNWDGNLFIRNEYLYTNLSKCKFSWKLIKSESPFGEFEKIIENGQFDGPDAFPGETTKVKIDLNETLEKADIFILKAFDRNGKEICNWNWPVKYPEDWWLTFSGNKKSQIKENINVTEDGNYLFAEVNKLKFTFSLVTGNLEKVESNQKPISFNGGPTPLGIESTIKNVTWNFDPKNKLNIHIEYDTYPHHVTWQLYQDGLLRLEADPIKMDLNNIDFIGIGFTYPEEKCRSVKWLGGGPYRVWKNRQLGADFSVWSKDYNNTVTGESFTKLTYPEFKGYHSNIYWVKLNTDEAAFTIYTETPKLFMQLFTPESPKNVAGDVAPPFPKTDISFLYEIPAIGTKFKDAQLLGPSGQKGENIYHQGDSNHPIVLWFDFSQQ